MGKKKKLARGFWTFVVQSAQTVFNYMLDIQGPTKLFFENFQGWRIYSLSGQFASLF